VLTRRLEMNLALTLRRAQPLTMGIAFTSVCLLSPGDGWAQDSGSAEAAPEGPSVAEAIVFINAQLSASPSHWHPCRENTVLTVEEDGRLALEISRENHCEDSRQTAHLLDLDPEAIEVAVEQEMVIRVGCVEGAECGRYWEKRKKHEASKWSSRDEDWRPRSQYKEQAHMLTGLEIVLSSDERYAQQAAEGIKYMLTAARKDPAYAEPLPFGAPPPAESEGGASASP
jgi:hypothetical protein